MSIVDNDLEKHNTRNEIAKDDKKEILLEKGRANLKTNVGNNQRLSIVDKGKEHNTRNEIAKDLKWILSQ